MENYSTLLRPVLEHLGWTGRDRNIAEAMPASNEPMTLDVFRDTLSALGYISVVRRVEPARVAPDYFPLIVADDHPHIISSAKQARGERRKVDCLLFPGDKATLPNNFHSLMARFRPMLRVLILISMMTGLAGLAPIFYNRVIYDRVIASGALGSLPMLLAGTMVALAVEAGLRYWRGVMLSRLGGRTDHVVSCSIFERLLFLPPAMTEHAAVPTQVNRLRDFDSVRDFVSGPLMVLLLEMPLVAIYLGVMLAVTGWLVMIPLSVIAGYAVLVGVMRARFRALGRATADVVSQRQEFLIQTVEKLRDIRLAGMEQGWHRRFRDLSGQAAIASFHATFEAQVLETLSFLLMTAGGVATIAFGVERVISQSMSTGALMVAIMLAWRILAPLQACCASLTRLQQLKSSTAQVTRLLAMPLEHSPAERPVLGRTLTGNIKLNRVFLRHTQDSDPALLGVSFDIKPGQIVAICGLNGSGKSSVLRVIAGLSQPQSGSVQIDGVDMRQFDPVAIRQSISYMPLTPVLLPGTVRDNLLYSSPEANDEDCRRALADARVLEDIDALPHGLDTLVEGEGAMPLHFLMLHKINLACAYMRPNPIMLFDEASMALGDENDNAFARKLAELSGKSTVIFVTHREDQMRLADQLLVMSHGELTHAGPSNLVLQVLKGRRA